MKCSDVRTFFSQVAAASPSIQVQPLDLNYLSSNGYLTVIPKDDYDRVQADVAMLNELASQVQKDRGEVQNTQAALAEGERKTHSFSFHFEGEAEKQADLDRVQSERDIISKDEADIVEKEAKIGELIQKKSMIDRMVPYGGEYVSLTGLGVITLSDLNIRNYRVSDYEFAEFVQELHETYTELRSIAERGKSNISNLLLEFVQADQSQLWSVAIGLAKLQGDQYQILDRFLSSLRAVHNFDSTIENKMMAAEIMTSFKTSPSQSPTDKSDLQQLSESLKSLDHDVRHQGHVPKELAAGVATTILSGRRYDGTFPLDRFLQYRKTTLSYETAAILSVLNVPTDQLTDRFEKFRGLFRSWGYETSEDTELSSAYLSISGFEPDDVKTKMVILLQALHNYLEYPIVAAAILASIPTLEANETLDLMEKAYTILAPYTTGLERSELVSLSVRMVHGIKNELVRQLDPTATLANTPIQFRYAPGYNFFIYHRPLIIAHSSYYSTFSGIGGAHPAHVHGYGGGFGG